MIKWFATFCLITGGALVASNTEVSGWGFPFFVAGSIAWLYCAILMREAALAVTSVVFLIIDLIGVYRWLF